MSQPPVAVVTGASGYLGSLICSALEAGGWQIVRLVRSPSADHGRTLAYDLGAPMSSEVRAALSSADVLVHAAYDLALTRKDDIWRVNVDGTHRLLEGAHEAHIRRILVVSSMSAYEGTTQLYGRAKLAIEATAQQFGGCAVRPGLVYGSQPRGMASALAKLASLRVVPIIAGNPRIYAVREDDLAAAVRAMADADAVVRSPVVSIAHPDPVPLRSMMAALAAREGRRCRFVSVPWQPVYSLLRAGEFVGLSLPFRADSLLGLVRRAPRLTGVEIVAELGLSIRAFDPAPKDVIGST